MEQISQEKAVELAAHVLKASKDELECKQLANEAGFYVSQSVRGGGQLMVANDGTGLFANSSVTYDKMLEAFNEGRRTDLSAF